MTVAPGDYLVVLLERPAADSEIASKMSQCRRRHGYGQLLPREGITHTDSIAISEPIEHPNADGPLRRRQPTPTPTPTPSPSPTPPAQAINLSTRMLVDLGDSVGIGGFIITGSAPKHCAGPGDRTFVEPRRRSPIRCLIRCWNCTVRPDFHGHQQ